MSKTRKTLIIILLALGLILVGIGLFIKIENSAYYFYCALALCGVFAAITALVMVMRNRRA